VTLALLGIGALGYGISIWLDLVYQVVKDDHVEKMLRMWSHYDQARKVRLASVKAGCASSCSAVGRARGQGVSKGSISSRRIPATSALFKITLASPYPLQLGDRR
jgi:hypothetical protein